MTSRTQIALDAAEKQVAIKKQDKLNSQNKTNATITSIIGISLVVAAFATLYLSFFT